MRLRKPTVLLLQARFSPSEDKYFGSYETLRYLSREMEGRLCERTERAEGQEKAGRHPREMTNGGCPGDGGWGGTWLSKQQEFLKKKPG